MKGVEGYETEGYTIMILMRMTFGEFDVSWLKSSTQSTRALDNYNAASNLVPRAFPNRPFPSCCEPHFESEAKFKAFRMKISLHCI